MRGIVAAVQRPHRSGNGVEAMSRVVRRLQQQFRDLPAEAIESAGKTRNSTADRYGTSRPSSSNAPPNTTSPSRSANNQRSWPGCGGR
jgi:hypothetical protein